MGLIMQCKELMKYLAEFPTDYDVRIPAIDGDLSPWLVIRADKAIKQVWITARPYAGNNPHYAELKLDEKGEFIKGECK